MYYEIVAQLYWGSWYIKFIILILELGSKLSSFFGSGKKEGEEGEEGEKTEGDDKKDEEKKTEGKTKTEEKTEKKEEKKTKSEDEKEKVRLELL